MAYKTRSGVHWDNVNGANIVGEADAAAWTEYTQAAKVWHNLYLFTIILYFHFLL
jgi:hypothetical protein